MKLSEVLSMRECRWVTSHLSEYLDRDPSAPLTAEEDTRLASHIAICEKCAAISREFAEISLALKAYRNHNDADSISRLTQSLINLTSGKEK